MKDKASVLAEVAKLQEIRDELTSEVTSLHAQLEQERSKTRISTTDVKPFKQTVRFFFRIKLYICIISLIQLLSNIQIFTF